MDKDWMGRGAMSSLDVVTSRPQGDFVSTTGRGRLVAATLVGNALELYDFALFSYFSVTLTKVFFPVQSDWNALLLVLTTFGMGFVTRPLGGLVFGAYADRHGRRRAIMLTIALMATGTAVVALCPGYDVIGPLAPILLVAGRLLQGFALGGEIGPATALLMEVAPPGRRGLFVSLQMASQGGSALLGAGVGLAVTTLLPPDAVTAGGWRIPFLLGLILAPVGLYLRATLQLDIVADRPLAMPGLTGLWRDFWRSGARTIVACVLLLFYGTATMYVIVFYMPTYLIKVMGLTPHVALVPGIAAGVAMVMISPLAGWISDQMRSRRPLIIASVLAVAVTIWPAFHLLAVVTMPAGICAIVFTIVALTAFGTGPSLVLILEAFGARGRVTGLAVVYSLGVSIFGGFAQFIVTWLMSASGDRTAPAWYVIVCAGGTLAGLALLPRKAPES